MTTICFSAAPPVSRTELHLQKSDRIFAGERAQDAAFVSLRLRRAGPPPGNHGRAADLQVLARGTGDDTNSLACSGRKTSTVHAGRRGSLGRVPIGPVRGALLVC